MTFGRRQLINISRSPDNLFSCGWNVERAVRFVLSHTQACKTFSAFWQIERRWDKFSFVLWRRRRRRLRVGLSKQSGLMKTLLPSDALNINKQPAQHRDFHSFSFILDLFFPAQSAEQEIVSSFLFPNISSSSSGFKGNKLLRHLPEPTHSHRHKSSATTHVQFFSR